MKILSAAALISLALFLSGPEARGGEDFSDNSCVSCHATLAADTFVGSNYHDWKNSIHAESGVTCEMCHGGSPRAKEKDVAHQGVYKSGDPRSRVYFQNVPATCGGCHEDVYREFTQSDHFRRLEKTGSGPTCSTCHGSRATWIITPQNLGTVCYNCHNDRKGIETDAPNRARVLLMSLNQSTSLHDLLGTCGAGEGGGERLARAGSKIDRAKIVWHSFDLEAVAQLLLEANESLEAARTKGP